MNNHQNEQVRAMIGVTRREILHRVGAGMGALGLASVFSSQQAGASYATNGIASNPLSAKSPMFAPRAKRIIHLFMNGGPAKSTRSIPSQRSPSTMDSVHQGPT